MTVSRVKENDIIEGCTNRHKDAADKLLCELLIVLPYLPDPTQIITQGVLNAIVDECPGLNPTKYKYCSACGKIERKSSSQCDPTRFCSGCKEWNEREDVERCEGCGLWVCSACAITDIDGVVLCSSCDMNGGG